MSRPLKMILPDVGSVSLISVRERVVLPQPDSPTSPSVSVDGVDVPHGALEEPGADREVLDEVLHAEDLVAGIRPLVDGCERLGAHATADSENLDLRPISSSEK